jgi:hypothetical protein
MLYAAALLGECEEAAAVSRLVTGPVDRNTRIVTIQQGADATMADEEDVARFISSQDVFDLADDARLGIDRPLPAPNADLGPGKKLIGDCLKFVRSQEAGRRSIILVHRLPNLYGDIQPGGNDLGCLDRLSLAARDNLCRARKLPRAPHPLRANSSDLAQAPGRDRDRRINVHLRMGEIAYEAHLRILTRPMLLVGAGADRCSPNRYALLCVEIRRPAASKTWTSRAEAMSVARSPGAGVCLPRTSATNSLSSVRRK